jgi:hypothetical protein
MALQYHAPLSQLTVHYDDASGDPARAAVLMVEISDAQRAVTGWIVAPDPTRSGETVHVASSKVRRIEGIGDVDARSLA